MEDIKEIRTSLDEIGIGTARVYIQKNKDINDEIKELIDIFMSELHHLPTDNLVRIEALTLLGNLGIEIS